jgi:glycosyltransferase involved in cell wall biosynthesis
MKVAFVHNFCTHYTRPTFELLSKLVSVDYYFFSEGEEWYWQPECEALSGDFKHEYLRGFRIGRTRVTPSLITRLFGGSYDAYIKCINGRFALPLTFLISRLKGKPFILRTGIWMKIQTPVHRLVYPITRFIYRSADAHVVYGEHTKKFLISEGVDPSRIFVAPHAVENERYSHTVPERQKVALREHLRIRPEQKVILHVGRLEKVKGVHYLIEAFRKVQGLDAVLVVVGSGSEKTALEAQAKELGIENRVRFVGHISPKETIHYYAIAHCLVLASVTLPTGNELWGLVVNEAFNQGVPVIATTAVGAAAGGLVVDQVNGLIVPERNSEALGVAIKAVLDDGELRSQLSLEARRSIQDWTPLRMAEAFRDAIYFALRKELPKKLEAMPPPSPEQQAVKVESRM